VVQIGREFPDNQGCKRRNFYALRQWYLFHSIRSAIVPQSVAQILWGYDRPIVIESGHGFHHLDFLPENDRTRYTIGPEARRVVLERLLELNYRRHGEEGRHS